MVSIMVSYYQTLVKEQVDTYMPINGSNWQKINVQ